jgi:hypothetical protein
MVGNIDVLLDGKYLMITEWKSILLNKEFIMPEEIKIMDPKYKTLIPLVIIFFIFGVVIGYVAHKPETVEKIITVTITPTPTPAPTPTPTPTISDFTVKIYEPSIDIPTKTIELTKRGAEPDAMSIRSGDTVLIKITDSPQSPLTVILNATYSRKLGTSGAVVVTFNKIGTYSLKAIIPSGDPNILPTTYATGTISVY